MVTKATEWKGRITPKGEELPLPSGNTALVRRIRPEAFLLSGMIPDPLSKIVRDAINSRQGLRPTVVEDIMNDPAQVQSALLLIDRVTAFCVVEPVVEMPPTCVGTVKGQPCGKYEVDGKQYHDDTGHPDHHKFKEGKRDPDVLYVDEVALSDKQFIFQWALGGVADLATFRGQLEGTVESLPDGQVVRPEAVNDPGDQ